MTNIQPDILEIAWIDTRAPVEGQIVHVRVRDTRDSMFCHFLSNSATTTGGTRGQVKSWTALLRGGRHGTIWLRTRRDRPGPVTSGLKRARPRNENFACFAISSSRPSAFPKLRATGLHDKRGCQKSGGESGPSTSR